MSDPAGLVAFRQMQATLGTPLSTLRGVGPKVAERLRRKGLHTLGDALLFLPHRYDDRTNLQPICALTPGLPGTFRGRVISISVQPYARRRVLEAVVGDDSGTLTLKWFRGNFAYLQKTLPVGTPLIGTGPVKAFLGRSEIHHPELEVLDGDGGATGFERVVPIYSEVEGVHPRALRRILIQAVEAALPAVVELLPAELRAAAGVPPIAEAYRELHLPGVSGPSLEGHLATHRRALVMEEFFILQLGLLLKKAGTGPARGIAFRPHFRLIKQLLASLPFRITPAQKRVLGEIRRDMEAPRPMHRLLQGDVGSGKTLVALLSALVAVESGHQAAIMAPTEILAEQHFLNLTHLLAGLPVRLALLTSSTPKDQRAAALQSLNDGSTELVVGTHALIQEAVGFRHLGLVVVDEQHRFGVMQRADLVRKGGCPDLLVMTATPIPRSLSMTVYGDLDLSVIDELPPGRQPVQTRVLKERDCGRAYGLVRSQVAAGRQAYLVYPLVDESDKLELRAATTMAEHFSREVFPDLAVGLLHGRLRSEEKEATMAAFSRGEIQVLVSTTVIEVGIDVPNATLMVVEHAERFGLSQLHQLRGRVGRGAERSHCILIAGSQLSRDGWQRLRIMAQTQDGFRIAEEDLKIRGPGDLLGTRQSGLPDFRVGNILRDGALLQQARDLAHRVLAGDPRLNSPAHAGLRAALVERWRGRLELAQVG